MLMSGPCVCASSLLVQGTETHALTLGWCADNNNNGGYGGNNNNNSESPSLRNS